MSANPNMKICCLVSLCLLLLWGCSSDLNKAAQKTNHQTYWEHGSGTKYPIKMIAIPAGEFNFSIAHEKAKGVQDQVVAKPTQVDAFWIGETEITWGQFQEFWNWYHVIHCEEGGSRIEGYSEKENAVYYPEPMDPHLNDDLYFDLDGARLGKNYPAVSMSRFNASQFCKWLSLKTGRFYRLPTQAEWEYACKAGTQTAYWFGDDPLELNKHEWYGDNALFDPKDVFSDWSAQPVGRKSPNPFGLYDMHGNVSEWVVDSFNYKLSDTNGKYKYVEPTKEHPGLLKGGNYFSTDEQARSTSRLKSSIKFQEIDPNLPKSVWWYQGNCHIGFRIVRPVVAPSLKEQVRYWDSLKITTIRNALRETKDRQVVSVVQKSTN